MWQPLSLAVSSWPVCGIAVTAKPDISIIMPVYNGEPFVEAAIRSALVQEGDFEILAHDDGSTDGTLALLERLARDEPRLTVATGPNGGPANARNRCLARAKGGLIAFLDHDDLWPEGRLKRQVYLLAADQEAGAVLGHTHIFETLDGDGHPAPSPRARRVLAGFLQAGLFRKAALDSLGGFDPSLIAADDFDLFMRLIESPWRLEIDPEVAVYYRLHATQWTTDVRFAGLQTVRALHRSLQRRRRNGVVGPLRIG
jgi:glycosyltransferase involved in cell wall biosynthesis